MSLSVAEIGEIARLLEASPYSSIKLEMGEFRLNMRRRGARRLSSDENENAPVAPSRRDVASGPGADEVDVPAPFLGIYYHAPRPGHAPFVEVGDAVTEETVIGIIEVMKLMNSVRAGVRGTVVAMLAPNAENVEEGQSLIRVKVEG